MDRFLKPGAGVGLRFGAYATANIFAETNIELLQDYIIPALVHDITQVGGDVTWLDKDGPLSIAWERAPETAAAVTLLGLVGGGVATTQDIAQARELVGNRDLLLQTGFSPQQAEVVLALKDNPSAALAKVQELWSKREGTRLTMTQAALAHRESLRRQEAAGQRADVARVQEALEQFPGLDSCSLSGCNFGQFKNDT